MGGRREAQEGQDMCIRVADLYCCAAETNTTLQSIILQLKKLQWVSIQFSSVAQSGPTLCDPVDCSPPGFPVLHCLPEFAQTHVHCVDDACKGW